MLEKLKNFVIQKKLFLIGLAIAFIVAYLDLLTKEIAFKAVEQNFIKNQISHIIVTDFFNIVKVWNNGVSFGMFNDLEHAKLIFVTIVAIISIILLIWLFNNKNPIVSYALAFIIGGAFGNMIDRLQNSAVADFLDFHLFGYHWPAFNLADSAVFVGVAILLIDDLILSRNKTKNTKDEKTN